MSLLSKIRSRTAKLGIVGVGYVGLPLALEFARQGFATLGIESDRTKVRLLNSGRSYIQDLSDSDIRREVKKGTLSAASDYSRIAELDVVIVCVPTPLRKTKDPDISFITESVSELVKYFHKDVLVVVESTTYPGTTDEVVLPMIEEATGFRVGRDFYLAFSPERVDPGNRRFGISNTPKVVAGITPRCSRVAKALYSVVVQDVVVVSSTKTAEMAKLLENTFRTVNIALANEMAIMADRLGIDVWEVIEAAATKPFGFMPFYPGPGIGGHCLPVDPMYLSWKMRSLDYNARFIQVAGEINASMPEFVVRKVTDVLNRQGKAVRGSVIIVLGVSYKKDVGDTRESPALDIIARLDEKGAVLDYCDPYVPVLKTDGLEMKSKKLAPRILSRADCVIVVTDHSAFDKRLVLKHAKVIVDTRNALKGVKDPGGKVIRL